MAAVPVETIEMGFLCKCLRVRRGVFNTRSDDTRKYTRTSDRYRYTVGYGEIKRKIRTYVLVNNNAIIIIIIITTSFVAFFVKNIHARAQTSVTN